MVRETIIIYWLEKNGNEALYKNISYRGGALKLHLDLQKE